MFGKAGVQYEERSRNQRATKNEGKQETRRDSRQKLKPLKPQCSSFRPRRLCVGRLDWIRTNDPTMSRWCSNQLSYEPLEARIIETLIAQHKPPARADFADGQHSAELQDMLYRYRRVRCARSFIVHTVNHAPSRSYRSHIRSISRQLTRTVQGFRIDAGLSVRCHGKIDRRRNQWVE